VLEHLHYFEAFLTNHIQTQQI